MCDGASGLCAESTVRYSWSSAMKTMTRMLVASTVMWMVSAEDILHHQPVIESQFLTCSDPPSLVCSQSATSDSGSEKEENSTPQLPGLSEKPTEAPERKKSATEFSQEKQRRHIDMSGLFDAAEMAGKIGESISNAGRVIGTRVAATVADLVSSAFAHPTRAQRPGSNWRRGDPGRSPEYLHYQQPSMLTGILRLMGLDSSKLGAIALNGIIFLAQLISGALLNRPSPSKIDIGRNPGQPHNDENQSVPSGTPLSWMLDAVKSSSLLKSAQDPHLPDQIISAIQQRYPRKRRREVGRRSLEPHTGCIELLICKMSPFVGGMQRSLAHALQTTAPPKADPGENQKTASRQPFQAMFAHMPSANEVLENSITCDERFPSCKVIY